MIRTILLILLLASPALAGDVYEVHNGTRFRVETVRERYWDGSARCWRYHAKKHYYPAPLAVVPEYVEKLKALKPDDPDLETKLADILALKVKYEAAREDKIERRKLLENFTERILDGHGGEGKYGRGRLSAYHEKVSVGSTKFSYSALDQLRSEHPPALDLQEQAHDAYRLAERLNDTTSTFAEKLVTGTFAAIKQQGENDDKRAALAFAERVAIESLKAQPATVERSLEFRSETETEESSNTTPTPPGNDWPAQAFVLRTQCLKCHTAEQPSGNVIMGSGSKLASYDELKPLFSKIVDSVFERRMPKDATLSRPELAVLLNLPTE